MSYDETDDYFYDFEEFCEDEDCRICYPIFADGLDDSPADIAHREQIESFKRDKKPSCFR